MTRRSIRFVEAAAFAAVLLEGAVAASAAAIIIDHETNRLAEVPAAWVLQAKQTLHIAYGHTSHGSQLLTGMTAVYEQYGSLYAFADGGGGGALDLREPWGYEDLGYSTWASHTRAYLNANPAVNVVIRSWCGQVSGLDEGSINDYLAQMSQLEVEYPGVTFVYMTGHLDGSGDAGNLNQRNEQIRAYCRDNDKVLFDFADIESWDPGRAVNYMPLQGNDNCDYYQGEWKNWASLWTAAHPADELTLTGNRICAGCCAHSQALNCVQKAGAAWWLWARLAGWAGTDVPAASVSDATLVEGASGSTSATFTVSLNPAPTTTATVAYATADGTATAGSDYTATSGTLTFTPGTAQLGVAVPVLGDAVVEPDETFRLTLTGATNATLADAEGLGLIVNDDVPAVTVSDVTVTEGQSGVVSATFLVSLTPAPLATATVTYATADGTASAGSDYTATSGTLTFTPGTVQLGVAVPVLGDAVVEADETFRLVLTGTTNATLADAEGLGLIVNDDVPAVGTGFHPLAPCRVIDTRAAGGQALVGGASRDIAIGGACGVPSSARAVALNVTVTQATASGHLRLYASGQPLPLTSAVNFSAHQTRGNNGLLPVGPGAVLAVYAGLPAGATVHVVVDVSGFYD